MYVGRSWDSCPGTPAFGQISSHGVPAIGIIASTALGSVAMAVSFMGTSGASVFNTLVLMTGIDDIRPEELMLQRPPQREHEQPGQRQHESPQAEACPKS